MFALPASTRVYIASGPVDMRRGADSLLAIVQAWKLDPFNGDVFGFIGRRHDRAKLLTWHRGGFILLSKRLEIGKFRIPAVRAGETRATLDAIELMMLLDGIDVARVSRPAFWSPPTAA